MLRFGTNVDLSDPDKWGTQLSELDKLPKFLQVTRAGISRCVSRDSLTKRRGLGVYTCG